MSFVGLGVFWGILFLLVVMGWSRVWVNRRLCRKEHNLSVKERLAKDYKRLINAGRSDMVRDHLTSLVKDIRESPEYMTKAYGDIEKAHGEAKLSENKNKEDKGDPIQQTIDRIFTDIGLKDKEGLAAADAITECPTVTMEIFWVLLAIAITGVGIALAYWAWKRWSFTPDPIDICKINILECEDIESFCNHSSSDSDVKQCNDYCKLKEPLYTRECLVQHCNTEIAKVMATGDNLFQNQEIINNCYDQCVTRNQDGIASKECKALMCSDQDNDNPEIDLTCDTYCANPATKYGPYCIDRVCGETNTGACSCYEFLDSGNPEASAQCNMYCTTTPGDDLCRQYYCQVDPIVGCNQLCQTGVPFCAPDDIVGDWVNIYLPYKQEFVTKELRLGSTPTQLIRFTNRDNTKNLYAMTLGDNWIGINRSRQMVVVSSESQATLFRIIPSKTPHLYMFVTDPVQISRGYYTNLYMGYTSVACGQENQLTFVARPINSRLPEVEWWVGPDMPIVNFPLSN